MPLYPERSATLFDAFKAELALAVKEHPRDLVGNPRGTDTRYGPDRMARNARALMAALYNGETIASVADAYALLDLRRVEAAAVFSADSGPGLDRLNPLLRALVHATVTTVDQYAPEPPQVLVVGGPNNPLPHVHADGSRVAQSGPPFGIALDGHQRMLVVFLSAVYGPLSLLGYSLALTAFVSPSSRDDRGSALHVDRELAIDSPASYLAKLVEQTTTVVDDARPGKTSLPVFVIDARRDGDPATGIALDDRLDVLIEDAEWGSAVIDETARRTVLIEAGDPECVGGGGLNPHLTYHRSDGSSMDARTVRRAIESKDADAYRRLAADMEWIPEPPFKKPDGEDSVSVMALRGHVRDVRSGQRAKLLIMMPVSGQDLCYAVLPFAGDHDPYESIHEPGCHVSLQRDIAACALIHVGPSRWTGVCRRNSYRYAEHCYLPAKDCSVREHAFAIGSSARVTNLEFPEGPLETPVVVAT